ncbi:MAG: ArsB/NhaD family transporter [Xanthomonadales bacterium]|nr:ArsB/NhaD family transporter [Xanthomonadales bacterium]MDH4020546.1 ArsB/NhaD family transporter [Xanthomonadales bacterium]
MTELLVMNESMMISGIILAVTFIGIFTETFHGFHRAKFAMMGAIMMIIAGQYYGFYDSHLAVLAIDWNVVFLLGCMMAIVSIMIPTGGFEAMANYMARISKGRQFMLMVMLGTCVTLLSLLLDNVTTVVIFGPLIILVARTMKITPIPFLLAAALLSNTGGVATLVGDPPNLMIGSAKGIDFNTFVKHMGGVTFAAWITVLFMLRFLFRKQLAIEPQGKFQGETEYKDKKLWNQSLFVLGVMVIMFTIHHSIGWEPWMVSAMGLTLLVFIAKRVEMDHAMEEVEIPLLIFFISLFIVVGGVEHSGFLRYLGQFIMPFVQEDLLIATLVLMWVAAILSAAIDNIPFTAAMIPILLGMEAQGVHVTPLWWALSAGVGMGGNGTHIGSTANVYIVTISERLAKRENDPSLAITPWVWFRYGTPAMIATLIMCTLIFYFFFEFYDQSVIVSINAPAAPAH